MREEEKRYQMQTMPRFVKNTQEARIQWKQRYIERVKEEAARLAGTPMPQLTEDLFLLYEREGKRLPYEDAYFGRREYLSVFGSLLLEVGPSGEEYLPCLISAMEEILQEVTWALPAHVDRRQPGWERTVDLFASETAEALLAIAYGLRNHLPQALLSSVMDQVCTRVLEPYMSRRPYAGWEESEMNWNAVCNGSIGLCVLYLLDWIEGEALAREVLARHGIDREKLEDLISRVDRNLVHYLDGFTGDGACLEGMGYYTYGMSFYMAYVREREQQRRMEAGSDRNECVNTWGDSKKMQGILHFPEVCFFPSGRSLSFSDGDTREKYRMGLTALLEEACGESLGLPLEVAAEYDSDPCFRFRMIHMDLQYGGRVVAETKSSCVAERESGGTKKEIGRTQFLLPHAQWFVLHAMDGGGLAVKGGHNDEPHNHNDIGSFQCLIGDQVYLEDLGAGEYTADYFGEKRYDILNNSSFGHNAAIIEGCGQQAGRKMACDGFEVTEEEGWVCVRLSIGRAYDCKDRIRRVIRYEEGEHRLRLSTYVVFEEDSVEQHAAPQAEPASADSRNLHIQERLVTKIKPSFAGNLCLLEGSHGVLSIECFSGQKFREVCYDVEEATISNHRGEPEKIFLITASAMR